MSRRRSGLKNAGKVAVDVSDAVGEKIRWIAFREGITIKEIVEKALIEYLVKIGEVESTDDLRVER